MQFATIICARTSWLSLCFQVWQHCDCMGVNSDVEHYLCEQCEPRAVNRVNQDSPSYYSYKLLQLLRGSFVFVFRICIFWDWWSFLDLGSVPWGVSFSLYISKRVAAQIWTDHGEQLRIPFPFSLQEVPMIPRPHYAQPGCVYYICLLRDDLLLRQGTWGSGACWGFHQCAGISGITLSKILSFFTSGNNSPCNAGSDTQSELSQAVDEEMLISTARAVLARGGWCWANCW